jgi:hypothetical protein
MLTIGGREIKECQGIQLKILFMGGKAISFEPSFRTKGFFKTLNILHPVYGGYALNPSIFSH